TASSKATSWGRPNRYRSLTGAAGYGRSKRTLTPIRTADRAVTGSAADHPAARKAADSSDRVPTRTRLTGSPGRPSRVRVAEGRSGGGPPGGGTVGGASRQEPVGGVMEGLAGAGAGRSSLPREAEVAGRITGRGGRAGRQSPARPAQAAGPELPALARPRRP